MEHFWSELSMDIKKVKNVLQTFPNVDKDHLNDRVKKQRQGH